MKRMLIYGLFLLLALPLLAQSRFDRVEDLVDSLTGGSFSGAVLIGNNEEILYEKAFGKSNYEHGVPNQTNTIFNIASITKHFTAAGILLLEERGKLSVYDRVYKYIPDFPNAREIRLHHLLTHTAGLETYNNYSDYWDFARNETNIYDMLTKIKYHPPVTKPGNEFLYSNSGYAVLAYIIEDVSGMKYKDFLRENFFEPLGLENTGNFSRDEIIENRASAYVMKNGKIRNAPWYDLAFKAGSGSMFSTAEDLYRWNISLRENKILSKRSVNKMMNKYKFGYGYGLGRGNNRKREYYEHVGNSPGVEAYIAYFYDPDYFLIIISNLSDNNFTPLRRSVRDFVLKLDETPYFMSLTK